jgi:hypothetical protein
VSETVIMSNPHQENRVTNSDDTDNAARTIDKKEPSSSTNSGGKRGAARQFSEDFFITAIERYRIQRENAASSSTMRAIQGSRMANNTQVSTNKNNRVSNVTTSDDPLPSPNDDSDTLTQSDRDKSSSNSSACDGEISTNDNNTEDLIVHLDKKMAETEDKQAATVSEESGSSSKNNVRNIESSSSLAVQTGTENKSSASSTRTIDPLEVDIDEGKKEQEIGKEKDDEDAEAREAVDMLLGLHDSAPYHSKSSPSNHSPFEADNFGSKKRNYDHSSDQCVEEGKHEDHSPLKKRRYQKRGTAEDATPTEGMSELEKKRLASRISSRRTREREKLRGEYFRTIRKKLEKKNRKLREENSHIRHLIKKTKKEISASKTALPDAAVLPPVTVGSENAATCSAAIPQVQDQVLLLLLQQLLNNMTNGGGSIDSQQSPLHNPALLALLIAVFQSQGQGNMDMLLKLLQAVSQQEPQAENSLQHLLPLLLAAQVGNHGISSSSNQQQLLLQLLPVLMGSGQQSKGYQPAQQQLPQRGNNSAPSANSLGQLLAGNHYQSSSGTSAPPKEHNVGLNQLAALLRQQGDPSEGTPNAMAGEHLTLQGFKTPLTAHSQSIQALVPAAKTSVNAAVTQPFDASASQNLQPNDVQPPGTQSFVETMGAQAKPSFAQAGMSPVAVQHSPSQIQMQQLAMMIAGQGPQMQQQMLAWMSHQGNESGQSQQGFMGRQIKIPASSVNAGEQQQAQPSQHFLSHMNQLKQSHSMQPPSSMVSLDSMGLNQPGLSQAVQAQMIIQQLQMRLQELQAEHITIPNQVKGSNQLPSQHQLPNRSFHSTGHQQQQDMAPETFSNQQGPNIPQSQMTMMQSQQMQYFASIMPSGGNKQQQNFFTSNGNTGKESQGN